VKLGNTNGARALRGNREAIAQLKADARQRADDLRGIVTPFGLSGVLV
jgi:hypothetical protein